MSRGARSRAPWILWGATLAVLVATMVLIVLNGSFSEDVPFIPIAVVTLTGYATVGAVIASRFPRNPVGWLFMLTGMAFLLSGFASEYVTYTFETSPGSLPFDLAAALVADTSLFFAVVPIPLVFLLFPTGTLPSQRWRPVAWAVFGFFGLALVADAVRIRMLDAGSASTPNPLAIESLQRFLDPVLTVAAFGAIGASLASAAALLVRFRRAQGEERQQIRWVAYGVAIALFFFVATFATSIGLGPNETGPLNEISFYLFFLTVGLGIPLAAAVAMFRYRLYDLDIVIKKTVIAGVLATFIALVYLGVVIAVPFAVRGTAGTSADVFSLAAAVIVALAFNPVRRAARRLADRLVYGRRASPYEVLSEFSERVAETYSTEDVLPRMAQIVGAGTGATDASIWLRVGPALRPAASWPAGAGAQGPLRLRGEELPELGPQTSAFPVRHQGELLGAVSVRMPANDPMNPSKEALVRDLASQAGLVLRNVRLIEELRASRQRIVAAQDHERRRIERDIHDGAQQQLVALAVKLRLLEQLTRKDAARAAELAAELQAEANGAMENLRDLARGIYPPLLSDKGLVSALQSQARKANVPVEIEGDGVGRYAEDVESTVYFCVLEALQNVAKYAAASRVGVRLMEEAGQLRFEVTDDGVGFDPKAETSGTGLQSMADRVEAIGGTVEIRSEPGHGTTIRGRVLARGGARPGPGAE
ncbi:MAG TPA: GAF domain-containing sensor histidine kinase [Actinomycetota bacterium]|nr:GAF domain-containing sensor histidine kinase [Actinomycetota bacterium]